MPENILIGLISGVVAVGVAYMAQRNAPSRKVSDTAVIVTASGHVIGTLREEIGRLDRELEEARMALRERPTKAELEETVKILRRQLGRLGEVADETPTNGPPEPPSRKVT